MANIHENMEYGLMFGVLMFKEVQKVMGRGGEDEEGWAAAE